MHSLWENVQIILEKQHAAKHVKKAKLMQLTPLGLFKGN